MTAFTPLPEISSEDSGAEGLPNLATTALAMGWAETLSQVGCQTEDFLFRQVGESADFLYGKGAGGQGSGLIEDAVPDLGQCLHMAGAFDESAFF